MLILMTALLASAPMLPTVPTDESWRKQRPKAGPNPTPVLPVFERATLDNGLTILVSTEPSLPLVSFRLVTRGGAALDPEGKAGLASLTYAMLQEGAGDLDFLAFSDRVADLGANFGANSDRDRGSLAISGLVRNAKPMLDLLADAALRPTMGESAFKRRVAQTMAALQRRRGSPQGLAFEAVPALIYGAKHPFGHPPTGTLQTIPNITLSDIKAHHKDLLQPQHSALVATGAITLAEAKAMIEARFGKWTKADTKRAAIPPVEPKKRTKVVLIHKPKTPQTMVIVGRPLFGRGHPKEAATRVMNSVFGGNFSARLNMNIREAKGYAYGAYSQVAFRDQVGVMIAYASIRQDVTAEGLKVFIDELKGMVSKPPSEAEVQLAKAGMIRGLPGSFDTTTAIAGAASAIFVYGLPLDYYAKIGARYQAISLEAVRKAAVEFTDPSKMQILLVGDLDVIHEKVSALGLGELEIRKNP